MPEKPTYEELEQRILELEKSESYQNSAEPLAFKQFEKNKAIILLIEPDSGAIIDANIAAQNFYGYSIKTLKKMNVQELNILSLDEVTEKMQQAVAGNLEHIEFHHRLSSGEIRTVEVLSSPAVFNGKKFLFSIINDITDRKQAEEKLKANKILLRKVLDIIPSFICAKNMEGRFILANKKLANFYGTTVDKITGMLHADVCKDEEELKAILSDDRQVINDGIPKLIPEETVENPDGSITILEKYKIPFTANGEAAVLISVIDITERKHFEKSFVESKNRFSEMFKHMSSGVVIYEATKNAEDFIIKAFNTAAEKITKIKRKEALGKKLLEVFPSMDRAVFFDTLKKVWKSGKSVHIEPFYYEDDVRKGWREYKIYRLPSGEVVALFDDVTARMESESMLIKSEEKYRTLFDKSNDGIIVHNLSGQIFDTNCRIKTMLDYKANEFNLKKVQDLHPHSEMEKSRKAFKEIIRDGHTTFETKLRRHDGSIIDVEISSSIIDREKGIIQGVVRDLTDRKEMEKRLLQAHKMESIGSLAGGIAHDFNNILFPIIGMSELLMDDFPENSLEYENLLVILKAGKRGRELVKQILTISRQSERRMIPTRIQTIVKEVLKLSRATIPSYIEIVQHIQPDCGLTMADSIQIHQVVMNIITNAYHAVEEDNGDKLTVRLRETRLEGADLAGTKLEPGKYAILSVSDTGNGISEEVMDKIFVPYFTTKEQDKGTGLGLAVVYGIVQEHKGDITIHTEIGKGTTFNVYLPLIAKTAKPDGKETNTDLQTGNERILLVDDEPAIAKLEKMMLERLGYTITMFTSSIEALEVFQERPDSFDIVISDMNMPNMAGDKLAKEIRLLRSDIPFILCTGFNAKVDKEKFDSLGITEILMKPVNRFKMAETVRKVLNEAHKKK